MTATAPATSPAPASSKGLISRIFGVFFSPRATFADVAARPKVLGALVIGLIVVTAAMFALFSTEVGQQAWIDQQIKGSESFGRTMTDQQIQGMERIAPYIRYIVAVGYFVAIPIVLAIFSGIILGIFNAFLGGDATFKQVYAVVAHSGAIIAVQQLFTLPLDYVRETLSSPTNLAVFLPFLDENSFPARLLGSIDLFVIWWSISLAIGLGVLYRKRTGPIASTLLVIYVTIGLVIAAVKTALAGA